MRNAEKMEKNERGTWDEEERSERERTYAGLLQDVFLGHVWKQQLHALRMTIQRRKTQCGPVVLLPQMMMMMSMMIVIPRRLCVRAVRGKRKS